MGLLDNLLANRASKVAAAKAKAAPMEKAVEYANELNGSTVTKQNAFQLMRQGYTTDQAVENNLSKAEARKKAEADDKAAQEKLTTDLEALAAGILSKTEKTKKLNAEASVLAEQNKAVNEVLKITSFAEILVATQAAKAVKKTV